MTEGFPLIIVDLLPLFGMLALKILSYDIHFMVVMVIMFNGDDGDYVHGYNGDAEVV